MHHMTYVRKDVNKKIENSSFSNGSRKAILHSLSVHNTPYLAKVPDIFNIGKF